MSLPITIFLLCYNEMPLIQYTLYYYRKCFPSAKIVIWDNESCDGSAQYAESLPNVYISSFSTNDSVDDNKYLELKNHRWKNEKGWVIVADMDEWLDATEEDLNEEYSQNTTILSTQGFNVVDTEISTKLFNYPKNGYSYDPESKSVCFLTTQISDINQQHGAHKCNPKGTITRSKKKYTIYHFHYASYEYLALKHFRSRDRIKKGSFNDRQRLGFHYTQDIEGLFVEYEKLLKTAVPYEHINEKVKVKFDDVKDFIDYQPRFDYETQRNYEDLSNFGKVQLYRHFLSFGHKENRVSYDRTKVVPFKDVTFQLIIDKNTFGCNTHIKKTSKTKIACFVLTTVKEPYKTRFETYHRTWTLFKQNFSFYKVFADENVSSTTLDHDSLIVPCKEVWENLPVKLKLALDWALKNDFTHVIKCDDDILIENEAIALSHIYTMLQHDYSCIRHGSVRRGQKSDYGISRASLSSVFSNKPYIFSSNLTYAGGSFQTLSSNSLKVLCREPLRTFQNELFEDYTVGSILSKANIRVKTFPTTVISWERLDHTVGNAISVRDSQSVRDCHLTFYGKFDAKGCLANKIRLIVSVISLSKFFQKNFNLQYICESNEILGSFCNFHKILPGDAVLQTWRHIVPELKSKRSKYDTFPCESNWVQCPQTIKLLVSFENVERSVDYKFTEDDFHPSEFKILQDSYAKFRSLVHPAMIDLSETFLQQHQSYIGFSIRTWKASHETGVNRTYKKELFMNELLKIRNEKIFISIDNEKQLPEILSCIDKSCTVLSLDCPSHWTTFQKSMLKCLILGNSTKLYFDWLSTFAEVAWWVQGNRTNLIPL